MTSIASIERKVASALRDTAYALRHGDCRTRTISADELVEVLLAIADRFDQPVRDATNAVVVPCPDCGLADPDRLIWQDDEFVRCQACGTLYAPDA